MLSACKSLAGESGSRGGRREQVTQSFSLSRAAAIHALLPLPTDKCGLDMKGRGPETTRGREDQPAQH